MLLYKKLGKFLCRIGLHSWNSWWVEGHGFRYKHRTCKRKDCDKIQSRKMHWQTANGGWQDDPTPYGRWVK